MLTLMLILMAARLRTPSLQVVKDQCHVFSLQGVDDDRGDADVEDDDVKRMMMDRL